MLGIIMTLLGAAKTALDEERKEKQKEEKRTRRRSKASGLLELNEKIIFNFCLFPPLLYFIDLAYHLYFQTKNKLFFR